MKGGLGMINVYTDRKLLENRVILDEVDDFFNAKVSSKQFEEYDEAVMREIDNAKVLDYETGEIKTAFGLTNINNLSTGCKTVLVYLYMKRHPEKYGDCVLNVTGCGYNALESLFEQMDRLGDSDTILLLLHTDSLWECTNRKFLINGKHEVDEIGKIVGRDWGE